MNTKFNGRVTVQKMTHGNHSVICQRFNLPTKLTMDVASSQLSEFDSLFAWTHKPTVMKIVKEMLFVNGFALDQQLYKLHDE